MSKQITFYANRLDLIDSLNRIKTSFSLRFTDAWIHDSSEIPCFDDLTNWSDLGSNLTGNPVGAGFFLITRSKQNVRLKTIKMDDGSSRYKVEPLLNPGSIILQPSGVFCDEDDTNYLISGKFGTALSDKDSLHLFKDFKKLFLKGYSYKKKQFYIGPNSEIEESRGAVVLW
ncbi:MAG: hypothetical protein MK130_04970 [Puniceicoccaceae bacterium]|nr:hypothetical protein [Puniceicoccaceae bacterium]NRA28562.1 hypothetical protein [Opitutales bacterium]